MQGLSMRAPRWLGALATASLLLAACGDDSDDADQEEAITEEAPEADTADDEAGENDTEDAEDDAEPVVEDITAPGTSLSFGEAAIVPVERSGDEAVISATVVGVEQGTFAELEPLGLTDRVAGMVPYYVSFSFEQISGDDLGRRPLDPEFEVTLDDGTGGQDVRIVGTFDLCDSGTLPEDFAEGETAEGCSVFLANEGVGVESVDYTGRDRDADYYDNPVTWTE